MTAALGPLPLGGTPDGKAWCLKALHPADHEIMATRYPGGSQVPTVSSNFTQVMELVPDPAIGGHTTSWDARIFMRQDPVCPVSIQLDTRGDAGGSTVSFPWLNRTVSDIKPIQSDQILVPWTTDLTKAFDAFVRGKNFYRITHMGLTIEHVCSSTTNQGTVLSAQYAIEPRTSALAGFPDKVMIDPNLEMFGRTTGSGIFPLDGTKSNGWFGLYQSFFSRHYGEGPMDEEMLLQATNGYTGPAKDGLYIPLKLNESGKMVNVDKKYVLLGHDSASTVVNQMFPQRSSALGKQAGWPYFCRYDTDTAVPGGKPQFMIGCKECGNTVSHTLIRGLDPHASLRLYLRVGIEYVPEIDSETACFARMSPLPDEAAVKMYQEIVCRLKDAYPRDYNDKSKLLDAIDRLAKRLVPAIDKGLSFFAKLPNNPMGPAAAGLQALTSAYLAPAGGKGRGKGRSRQRRNPRNPQSKSASSSKVVQEGSKVKLSLSDGAVATTKVLSVVRPKKKN